MRLLRLLPTFLITTHRGKWSPERPGADPLGQYRLILTQAWSGTGSTLGDVRLTEFWDRMNAQFGEVYAQSVAKDFVFDKLGGRTVERALADGVDAKAVWRAVCDTFKVPENMR